MWASSMSMATLKKLCLPFSISESKRKCFYCRVFPLSSPSQSVLQLCDILNFGLQYHLRVVHFLFVLSREAKTNKNVLTKLKFVKFFGWDELCFCNMKVEISTRTWWEVATCRIIKFAQWTSLLVSIQIDSRSLRSTFLEGLVYFALEKAFSLKNFRRMLWDSCKSWINLIEEMRRKNDY